MRKTNYIEVARRTFEIESRAIAATLSSLDEKAFVKACELILSRSGRVIVSGIGKSGHVARKIASTLSSTGTPATFLHPSEAAHGDIGFVGENDTVIMLSKSGESDELAAILPALAAKKITLVAITMNATSRLAQAAEASGGAVLMISVPEEACPHDLAPTASTTAQLVLGDALAMALLEARNFTSEDFAKLHPAGVLGRKLTFAVRDLMTSGEDIPKVSLDATLAEVMQTISSKRLGITCVSDSSNVLLGVITDGDLRRYLQAHPQIDINKVQAQELMSKNPKVISESILAIDALHVMQDTLPKVMHLPVVDDARHILGVIHLHEIVRAGIAG